MVEVGTSQWTGDRRPETGDWRPKTRDQRPETTSTHPNLHVAPGAVLLVAETRRAFDAEHAHVWLNENSLAAGVKLLLGRDPKRDYQFSIDGYAVGINVLLYAMTH